MLRAMRHESCDRARRWISVALDDGLAELEGRLLEAHLARCADCRAFEERARLVTAELRRAELIPLACPIALPVRPRRLSGLRVASASAAAAAAALAVVGALTLATSNDQVQPSFLRQTANVPNTEAFDLREARRTAMVPRQIAPLFSHVQMARAEKI